MKQITIYTRKVLQRTGFKQYPYKESKQVSIIYNGNEYKNHSEKIDNSRLKVKFNVELQSRSKKALQGYINSLSRTNADKWIREQLSNIMETQQWKEDA